MGKGKINKFFVYGTLKEGGRFDQKLFSDLRTSVKEATIKGDLFSLGAFPTIKLDGDGIVTGEVHTFRKKDVKGITKVMDQIEGYNPLHPGEGLFNRHKIAVALKGGKTVTAWVYEYNGQVDPEDKLENGVWNQED